MSLIPVPALADNDLWLLHDDKHAQVVNPGDAGPVRSVHTRHHPGLKSILVTRHHASCRIWISSPKRAAHPDGNAARCTYLAVSADLRRPFTCESDNRGMATVPPHHFFGLQLQRPHSTERIDRNRPIKNQLK